jgi:hypothetical protein
MEHRSEYGEGVGMGEGNRPGGEAGRYDRASEAGRAVRQARERVADAYGRTAETAGRVYDRAIDFGRENPGTATLLALGAGVAVGLWLAGGDRGYRDRVVPTLATRVAEAMLDIFDGGR